MLATLAEKVDPKHAALLVVDVQNDFCHPEGALAASGVDLMGNRLAVDRILTLIGEARQGGLAIVYVQMCHNEWTETPARAEVRKRAGFAKNCWEGTWGAELYKVSPQPGEYVVRKHRYSAFFGTDLDLIVRTRGIRSVIVTGVATDVCVESTARDAAMRDLYVVLVDDCCSTLPREAHDATLRTIGTYFGVVATSGDVIRAWRSRTP